MEQQSHELAPWKKAYVEKYLGDFFKFWQILRDLE